MSSRRREGIRDTIATHQPTPYLRVTAHTGDAYQPPFVRIWHRDADDSLVWACAAELSPGEANAMAESLKAMAWAIAINDEEGRL